MPQNNQSPENLKFKSFNFVVEDLKTIERDGQKLGIIKGYASTYGNVDRGGEMVVKGAFAKSLARYRETNRQIRMYAQHDRHSIIGGYPIDKARDDDKGLYVEGEINLEVQKGFEMYQLAKQKVITDLSIGYSIIDADVENDVFMLKELELWEVSLVGEPMNAQATILEVKSAISKLETIKEVEAFLKETCHLSSGSRKTLISKIKSFSRDAEKEDLDSDERDVHSAIAERLEQFKIDQKLKELNKTLKGK